MSDDEKQTVLARDELMNMNDTFDLTYWTIQFGCTPARLMAAIAKVGASVRAVDQELKRN